MVAGVEAIIEARPFDVCSAIAKQEFSSRHANVIPVIRRADVGRVIVHGRGPSPANRGMVGIGEGTTMNAGAGVKKRWIDRHGIG